MVNGFLQIQMDDASDCPHRTFHARDCQPGKDFHIKLSRHRLSTVGSRLSDEGSIPLGRLVPSSLGTTLRNLRSMCTSLVVCLSTWDCLRVGCTTLSLSLFRN